MTSLEKKPDQMQTTDTGQSSKRQEKLSEIKTGPARFRKARRNRDTPPTSANEYISYLSTVRREGNTMKERDLKDYFNAICNWDEHNSNRCLDNDQKQALHALQQAAKTLYKDRRWQFYLSTQISSKLVARRL